MRTWERGETTGQHPDLVLTMSRKLEAMIRAEIGVDDGREMPEGQGHHLDARHQG